MEESLQRELVALNNEFYQTNAETFSATRVRAWEGWRRCAQLIEHYLTGNELTVSDIGCGNMRFERFLLEALPSRRISFFATDNCPALIPEDLPQANIIYLERDGISELLAGNDPLQDVDSRDVTCCFGFMHHIPGAVVRQAFLKAFVEHTKPGGIIIVSLWRFMDVPALAAKAASALASAEEDASLPANLREVLPGLATQGDYLLDWQGAHTWRYCHSFSDEDVQGLIEAVVPEAHLIEHFRADGKSGDANEYLVFQKEN